MLIQLLPTPIPSWGNFFAVDSEYHSRCLCGIGLECSDDTDDTEIDESEDIPDADNCSEQYATYEVDDSLFVGMDNDDTVLDIDYNDDIVPNSFEGKVKALVNHFSHCYNRGKLKWVRRNSDGMKAFLPVGRDKIAVMDRIQQLTTGIIKHST